MNRKRIAVITARADESEQSSTLQGIAAAVLSADMDMVVFSNRYNYWDEDIILTYENIIYAFFSPEQFDAVILMTEPFMNLEIIEGVIAGIRAAGIPVVVIGDKDAGLPVVESDDDMDMARITEHLITVHGFREFDILAGPRDNPIAQKRVKGCRDACSRYGITLSGDNVIHGNFWTDAGYELGRQYLNGERRLPQAVICSSDNMAHGLCSALEHSPIRIPEDLTVTGYDRSGQMLLHYALFTSCKRSRYNLGIRAVRMLFPDITCPESEQNEIILGDTCPCGPDYVRLGNELRQVSIQQYHMIGYFMSEFSTRLTLCRTLLEFTQVLRDFFHLLHDAEALHLMLDQSWNDGTFSGKNFLLCHIGPEYAELLPGTTGKSQLLPELLDGTPEPRLYYCSPLCFQTRNYGYMLLQYRTPRCYDFSFRDFSKTAANALELLRMKNDIHYLKSCQQLSALYDALTGFYTMPEFRRILSISAEQKTDPGRLYAVHLGIADASAHPHEEGWLNDLLAAAARAVKTAGKRKDLYCRGADRTFFILKKTEDDLFETKLKAMLHHAFAEMPQVVLTCVQSAQRPDEAVLESLLQEAEQQSIQALHRRKQRESFPHYKEFLALHQKAHLSPRTAVPAEEICRELCISDGYFRAAYQKCLGVSYSQDCINARIALACYLLCTSVMSIYSIAMKTGYKNEKYFARQFRQMTGVSPSQFRERCE